MNKDTILKYISDILFTSSVIPFLYWFFYDYEKSEGSALLIFTLMLLISHIIQTRRCWNFEDKEV